MHFVGLSRCACRDMSVLERFEFFLLDDQNSPEENISFLIKNYFMAIK